MSFTLNMPTALHSTLSDESRGMVKCIRPFYYLIGGEGVSRFDHGWRFGHSFMAAQPRKSAKAVFESFGRANDVPTCSGTSGGAVSRPAPMGGDQSRAYRFTPPAGSWSVRPKLHRRARRPRYGSGYRPGGFTPLPA